MLHSEINHTFCSVIFVLRFALGGGVVVVVVKEQLTNKISFFSEGVMCVGVNLDIL